MQANNSFKKRNCTRIDPIVQLSCCSFHKLILVNDGSWSTDCVLASLEVNDLMSTRISLHSSTSVTKASFKWTRLLFLRETLKK